MVVKRAAAPAKNAVTGTGASFGTFGELLQGALAGSDQDFLVTLPIARWATVRITLDQDAAELRVSPGHKRKALHVARSLLESRGVTCGGTVELEGDLPEGKGMSSSSADLVATVRAVGDALGAPVTPVEIEDFLRDIEPTDGLMYGHVVAFYHRQVRLCRVLPELPPLTIVGIDEGGQVDTVHFNASRPAISAAERREYAGLLDLLETALAARDLAKVGAVSTRSALLNQPRCAKRHLTAMLDISRDVGALGVAVAHSGTMIGILIGNDDPQHAAKVSDASAGCAELAGAVSVDHTFSPSAQTPGRDIWKIAHQ